MRATSHSHALPISNRQRAVEAEPTQPGVALRWEEGFSLPARGRIREAPDSDW